MPRDGWRLAIFSGWKIQPFSTRAAQDCSGLIMMSWPPEPFREDRTRKFLIGVSHAAENLAKKKFLFGTHSFPNAAGGMKPAPSWMRPRNGLVGKIALTFKRGWTSMTPK